MAQSTKKPTVKPAAKRTQRQSVFRRLTKDMRVVLTGAIVVSLMVGFGAHAVLFSSAYTNKNALNNYSLTNCKLLRNPIRQGNTGACVKTVQAAYNAVADSYQLDKNNSRDCINAKTYQLLDVDGDFGSKTYWAMRCYQNQRNLSVDGVVGNDTYGKFITDCKKSNLAGSFRFYRVDC